MKNNRLKKHSTDLGHEHRISSFNLLSRKRTELKIAEFVSILPRQLEIVSPSKLNKDLSSSKSIVFREIPRQLTLTKSPSAKSIINEKINQLNEVKVLNLQLPLMDKSKKFITSFNVFKKHSLSPIKNASEAKIRGYSLNSQYPEFIIGSETSTKAQKGCMFKYIKL